MKNKTAIIIFLALFITACSPVRQLEHLQKKHPYLFNRKLDTLTIHDTIKVMVAGVRLDTVVHESRLYDTITLHKNQLTVKVWKILDSVYIDGKCDTIYKTVYRELKVPYAKYEAVAPRRKSKMDFVRSLFMVLCIGLVMFSTVLFVWRKG